MTDLQRLLKKNSLPDEVRVASKSTLESLLEKKEITSAKVSQKDLSKKYKMVKFFGLPYHILRNSRTISNMFFL
jgi:hypothetical protein